MYRIIEVKMTWRPEKATETGSQELERKINEAVKEGYKLDRLCFNNVDSGPGYNPTVTAYAVMVNQAWA